MGQDIDLSSNSVKNPSLVKCAESGHGLTELLHHLFSPSWDSLVILAHTILTVEIEGVTAE